MMKSETTLKQTEVGLIPENWEYLTVQELVDREIIEKPIDGNHGNLHPKGDDFVKEGFPFITASEISDGIVNLDSCKYITKIQAENLQKGFSKEGDVLITHKGVIGRTALVGPIKTDYLVLSPQVTYYRVKNTHKLLNDFLKYYFDSPSFQRLIKSWAQSGSTRDYLGITEQRKLPIVIPSLDEQRSIAKFLSDLDRKVELYQRMIKTLEEIGQMLFKHWFIDFEFLNEDGNPYKTSGGEMVYNEELEKAIPRGWKAGSIYEISDVVYGAPFSSSMFNKEKKGLPLIRIRDLKDSSPEFYTTEKHPNATIIFPGDVIAGMDAEFRPYIWLGEKSYLNQRLCYFKPKNGIHKYFILNTVRPLLRFFENAKVGTTVIHLGKSDIDTWKVIIPTDKVNREFSIIIDALFTKIINNAQENKTLQTIRDSLLPKLMSGKIRIPIESR